MVVIEAACFFSGICLFIVSFVGAVKIGAVLLGYMPNRLIKQIAGKVSTAIKW